MRVGRLYVPFLLKMVPSKKGHLANLRGVCFVMKRVVLHNFKTANVKRGSALKFKGQVVQDIVTMTETSVSIPPGK